MATRMPGKSFSGELPPLTGEEQQLSRGLKKHVVTLGEEIGERNVWNPGTLDQSAEYIEGVFKALGYEVAIQEFEAKGQKVRNIEVEIKGTGQPDEIVIVGAHYDSVMASPGANDNGTGTAGVIELARLLAGKSFPKTVRFVAFVNEEPPFFQGRLMGSYRYAARSLERAENVVAMLSLETMGCYFDEPGTQRYPVPFNFFYPSEGNFIGFVGNVSSRGLVRRVTRNFREHTSFPAEGVAAPGFLTGIGWSDHWSFWQQGYPAVMVTDTALFRYRYYHTIQDTPDKVDYDRLARVVAGLSRVVIDLAGGASKPEKKD